MEYKNLRILSILLIIGSSLMWILGMGLINTIDFIIYIQGVGFSHWERFMMLELKTILWILSSIIFGGIIIASILYLRLRKKRLTKVDKTEEKIDKIPIRQNRAVGICPSCGAEVLDKTGDFCSKCGVSLK